MDDEVTIPVQSIQPEKLPSLEWQAFEYDYTEKNPDWFWIVGIAGGVSIILTILFKDFLFGIVLLLGTFTAMMYGARKPELITFTINAKGLRAKNEVYLFKNLQGFALKSDELPHKLMIHSDRIFLPHIIIPLANVDPELIRERLIKYLPEEHFEESVIDLLIERLGF